MTEIIRSWPDSLFYMSQAGTANVREQINKTQLSATLLRALSDSATVDSTGSKLDEILTGLSLGKQTQRHKWRVLYDTSNDRLIVQRNSGTDAAKVWVELFRIDSSGNVTTTGTLTTDSITLTQATSGGVAIRMAGDLDMNDFYIRNAEDIYTQSLRVGQNLTLSNNHRVGLVYITTKTASNSPVIDFTGLTNYPAYVIQLENVQPGTDAVSLQLNVSTNGGASYDSTANYSTSGVLASFPALALIFTSATTTWNLLSSSGVTQDNAAASALSGEVKINSLGTASFPCRIESNLSYYESTGSLLVQSSLTGNRAPVSGITAFRFTYSSGLIASGTFRLYGVRNS